MRTTNNIQKTENRPIKKTISKTFAIIVSLVLISFTVSAQGFWKHLLVNNTYGKMAELMVEQKNADDQLLKSGVQLPKTIVTRPVITTETELPMAFEIYFGSQWINNPKTSQAPSSMLGLRIEDSILSN